MDKNKGIIMQRYKLLVISIFSLTILAGCASVKAESDPTVVYSTALPTTLSPTPTLKEPTTTVTPEPFPTIEACLVKKIQATPVYDDKLLHYFQTKDPFVVLTIDDGWSDDVLNSFLDVLEKTDMHATFFLLGLPIENNVTYETLKRLVDNGNEIGYHSYDHPEVAIVEKMTKEEWEEDYARWSNTLHEKMGDVLFEKGVKPYVRIPYGPWSNEYFEFCEANDLIPVYWTNDKFTFEKNRMPLKAGAILILHIFYDDLPALNQLAASDWDVYSLSEVLPESCQ